jgi:adenine phosphoribosyltransferase
MHAYHKPGYLDLIDTNTTGPRYDVTPLFANHAAFDALLHDFERLLAGVWCDVVAGIDALGFILGTALALRLQKGFVPVRKGGKLPVAVDSVSFVDYSGLSKTLEVRHDALKPGMRVLVADEWVETGTQVKAAATLIERQGGIVAGIVVLQIDTNAATQSLHDTYPCYAVWTGA